MVQPITYKVLYIHSRSLFGISSINSMLMLPQTIEQFWISLSSISCLFFGRVCPGYWAKLENRLSNVQNRDDIQLYRFVHNMGPYNDSLLYHWVGFESSTTKTARLLVIAHLDHHCLGFVSTNPQQRCPAIRNCWWICSTAVLPLASLLAAMRRNVRISRYSKCIKQFDKVLDMHFVLHSKASSTCNLNQ